LEERSPWRSINVTPWLFNKEHILLQGRKRMRIGGMAYGGVVVKGMWISWHVAVVER
jgi:hypothetical protein